MKKIVSAALILILTASLCLCSCRNDVRLRTAEGVKSQQWQTTKVLNNQTTTAKSAATETLLNKKTNKKYTEETRKIMSKTNRKIYKSTATKHPWGKGSQVSSIPQPIVNVDSDKNGARINISKITTIDLKFSGQKDWNSHISVIKSYKELIGLYKEDVKDSSIIDDKNYAKSFTMKFFNQKALLILFINSSGPHKIDNIVRRDDQICIQMRTKPNKNNLCTNIPSQYRTIIEVQQSDIIGVNDILVFNTEWSPKVLLND